MGSPCRSLEANYPWRRRPAPWVVVISHGSLTTQGVLSSSSRHLWVVLEALLTLIAEVRCLKIPYHLLCLLIPRLKRSQHVLPALLRHLTRPWLNCRMTRKPSSSAVCIARSCVEAPIQTNANVVADDLHHNPCTPLVMALGVRVERRQGSKGRDFGV
jgi:hypothetical protein